MIPQMKRQAVATQFASSLSTHRASAGATPRIWPHTAIVGLLLAASEVDYLPASGWPLEAAVERLAAARLDDVDLNAALARWARPPTAGRVRFPARDVLRDLLASGSLHATAQQSQTILRVDERWVARHLASVAGLSTEDRSALARAAQVLQAMATISSKTRVA
jgi:hypothetical protein